MVQEITLLKPEVVLKITGNKQVMARLQLAFNKSYFSVYRWIKANDAILTTHTALTIISEELKLPVDQLI